MNNNIYNTITPNTPWYKEYSTQLVENKYKTLFDNLNFEESYEGKGSYFKVPKLQYSDYDITLFDLGVYVLINSIVNRTSMNTNWIDITTKKDLATRLKHVFRKSPSDLRISTKIDSSINNLEKEGLIQFISNKVKIPFVEERYAYIPHIDMERITATMIMRKTRHNKYIEALGTYMLMISTNYSENTKKFNGSTNGIIIAPRSIRSLSAATITTIKSIPPNKPDDDKNITEYSNQKINKALDWLEGNRIIATIHIYDYQHVSTQRYEEVVFYTALRNIDGLKHFYESYIYSEYNQYAKLNEIDALRFYPNKKPENIITNEYCQQMSDSVQPRW